MRNTSKRKRIDFIKYRHKHRHRVKIKVTNGTKIKPTACDLRFPSEVFQLNHTSCQTTVPHRKPKRAPINSRVVEMSHEQPTQSIRTKIVHLLFSLLCLMPTTVQSFCPFKCICDDQHLSANCTQVPSISIVPMTFNPLLRHLILNQLPMSELSNSLSFYRQLEYLDLRLNQIRQITYQNFNFKPALTALLPAHRHIDSAHGAAHGLNTSQEILEHNVEVAKNLKQAIYKSLDQSIVASNGMGDSEDEIKFHLRVLDLSDNRIEEIGSLGSAVVGANSDGSIREDFRRIKSSELEKTSPFLTLTKLERLGLGGNRLTHLHKHVFLGLVHLTYLDLSRNNIEHIDPHAFVSLIELRVLDLSQNRLARQLSHLSIAICRAPMNELQDLDLSENLKGLNGSVEVILPNQMFMCAPKLVTLNLNALNLQYIQVYAFDNLRSLDLLNLSQNFLEQVPSDALRNIGTTLKHLDLSDNLIEFVNANVFTSLQALERLFMNSMPRLVSFDLASLNTNPRQGPGRHVKEYSEEINNNGYNFQSALKSFLPEHLFMTQTPPNQQMSADYQSEYIPSNENLVELQLMNNSRLISLHSSLAAGLDRPSIKIRFSRWEHLKLSGATELHELPLAEMVDLQRLSTELRVDLSYAAHLNCSSCQMNWLIRAARQRLIEVSNGNQQQTFSPFVRDWDLVLFDKHNPYASQQLGEKVKLTSDTTGCFAPFNVPLMEFARVVETSLDRCNNQATPVSTGREQNPASAASEKLPSASNNFPAHVMVDQSEPPRFSGSPLDEETNRLLHQHHRAQHKEDTSGSEQSYSLLSLMVVLVAVLAGISLKLVFTFLVRHRYGLKWRSPSSVTTSIDSPSSFQHNNFNQNLDRCLNPDGFYYNSTSYVQKHVSQLQSATTQRLARSGGEAILNNIVLRTNVGSIERTHKRNDLFSRIAAFWHRRRGDSPSSSLASSKELPPAINGFLSRHWNTASQLSTNNFHQTNVLMSCNEFPCNDETSSVQHPDGYWLAPDDAAAGASSNGTKIVEVSVGQAGHKVLDPLRSSQHRDSSGYRREGMPEVEQIYGLQHQQDIAFQMCNRGDNNPMTCNRIGGASAPNQVNTQVVVGETNEVKYEDFIYANSQQNLGAAPVNSFQTRKNQPIGKSAIREQDEQDNKVHNNNRLELHQQQLEAMSANSHLRGVGPSAYQSQYSSMTETTATLQHHLRRQHQQQAARPSNSTKSQNDVPTTDEKDKRRADRHRGSIGVSPSSAMANGTGNNSDNWHATKRNGSRPNANDRSALCYQYGDENSQVGRSGGRQFAPAKSTANVPKQQQRQLPCTMASEQEFASAAHGDAMFADDGHIYVTLDNRPIEQHRQLRVQEQQQQSRRDEVDDYDSLCAERGEHEEATTDGNLLRTLEPSGGRLGQAQAATYNKLSDHLASDSSRITAQSNHPRGSARYEHWPTESHKLEQWVSVRGTQASTNSSDSGLGLSSAMNVRERRQEDPGKEMAAHRERHHSRLDQNPSELRLGDMSGPTNCRNSENSANVIRESEQVSLIETAGGHLSNRSNTRRDRRKSRPEVAINVKSQSEEKSDLQHSVETDGLPRRGYDQQLTEAKLELDCDKTKAVPASSNYSDQVADRTNSDCPSTTNGAAVSSLASRYDANHAYRGDLPQQQPEPPQATVRRAPLPPSGVPAGRITNTASGNSGVADDDDYVINGLHDQNKRSKSRRLRQQQHSQQMDPITDRARQRHTFSDMGGTDATTVTAATATASGTPTETSEGISSSVTDGNRHNNDFVGAPSSYGGGGRGSYGHNDDNANDFADRQDAILIGQQPALDQRGTSSSESSSLTNTSQTRTEFTRNSLIQQQQQQQQQYPSVRQALANGSLATTDDGSITVARQMQQRAEFVTGGQSKPTRGDDQQNDCDNQQQLPRPVQTTRNNHTNTLGSRKLPNHSQLTTNNGGGGNEIYSNQFYYCRPTMATLTKSETLNRHKQPPPYQSNLRG